MGFEVGNIVEGTVTGITKFGAFVDIGDGITGMVHISEISSDFVKEIGDVLSEGDKVKVKILKLGDDKKVSLSIKAASAPAPSAAAPQKRGGGNFKREEYSFEDMMNKFKLNSDEKMSDLKRSVASKRGTGGRRGSGR